MVKNKLKVIAIIQVRLGSERLPMKAFLPLPFSGGPSLLEHVVKRAKASSNTDTVIVATTDTAIDNPIEDFCKAQNLDYFRGSSDNVLHRFQCCSEIYKADVVVRLTGDNPFIQPATIDEAIQKHIESNADYTITEGLPLGTNIEVVSANALAEADKLATEPADREHVTPYIRRSNKFRLQTLTLQSEITHLRLTVDHPSDYALASMLYAKLYEADTLFDLDNMTRLVQVYPWLSTVNSHNYQKKVYSTETEEQIEAVKLLRREGFTKILDKLV